MVYKTHEEPAAAAEKPWWQWTREHVDYELEVLREALGQALGMKGREVRGDLMREIDFLKRELAVLREEVAAASKLKALREEVEAAQATIPRVPDLVASLKAQQAEMRKETARLRRELATAKDGSARSS